MTLHDKFGRQITDLRISVTDRCNFRCVYCRSADPENYRDHDEILSWPELDRLARIFLSLGIRKIRITGGEPLVREGVEDYIARLHALGVEDLSMTPNGHLLAERCDRLLAAGPRQSERRASPWPQRRRGRSLRFVCPRDRRHHALYRIHAPRRGPPLDA